MGATIAIELYMSCYKKQSLLSVKYFNKLISFLYYNIEIVEFTDSINVIVNSSVQYSCTGIGSNIYYRINGSVASNFIDQGFITQVGQDTLSDNLKRRNLTLTSATIDLNNTNVQCRIAVIYPWPISSAFSNLSILTIQGK